MIQEQADLDTLIIDTVGSLVVVVDREGRILRFNAGGTRLLGYSADEVLGKVIWEILPPPESRAMARERVADLLRGQALEFPCVWLTRDGQVKHLSFSCKGAPGPSGQIEYVIGSAIDITDRVATEQALRESEQRFRTTFNDAAIGIALVDESGHYIHGNRAFCELTGYEESELLKVDLLAITHPDDRDGNWKEFRRLLDGEVDHYVYEKRYIRRNGQTVWVRVSASLGSGGHGRPRTVIGLFENVSDRRRTEDALKEAYAQVQVLNEKLEQRVEERTAAVIARTQDLARSEGILRSVLDSMGDGVYVADERGRVTMMNPAAERMTGPVAPGSETITERARRPWFFRSDGITPFSADELQLARCARGEVIDDEETLIRRPGFAEIWVSATGRPLRDETGVVRGAVLVLRDVTERKKHEAARREASLSLEKANASLRESERHFKELADSNFRLAREVEHRVRNNLQGLLGLISVMRDRAPDVRSFADAMQARLAAMRHVHQLLAQKGWTAVGLRELVAGALSTLQHVAPNSASMCIDGPAVSISPSYVSPLTLVLAEWFTNSCKYGAHSAPGGRLDIHWNVQSHNGDPWVRLTWSERAGVPIHEPATSSLGTELVQSFVRRELGGICELSYPPEGAAHVIEFPLRTERAKASP